MMPRNSPSVVLVGRPNVGKSTLFNRITGSRRAIVAPVAGTTRDSLARPAVWRGTTFQLFDTGGMFGASEDPLHELVVQQGQRAIAGADLLVFVVDGREGLVLRRRGDRPGAARRPDRPVLLAINKTDDKRAQASAMEFYPARLRSRRRDLGRARARRGGAARRDRRTARGSGLKAPGRKPAVEDAASPQPPAAEPR